MTLPDLTPVAAAGGADLHGHTALTLRVTQQNTTTDVALNGTLAVTGGQAQAQALLGDAAQIELAASLTGSDARLTAVSSVSGRNVASAVRRSAMYCSIRARSALRSDW